MAVHVLDDDPGPEKRSEENIVLCDAVKPTARPGTGKHDNSDDLILVRCLPIVLHDNWTT